MSDFRYDLHVRHAAHILIRMDDARINTAVGAELRAARARRDWSREELSRQSGVAVISIRRYENGNRSIPVDTLVRLTAVLGLDIADVDRAIRHAAASDDGSDSDPKGERAASARDSEAAAEARRRKAAAIKKRVPRSANPRKRRQD